MRASLLFVLLPMLSCGDPPDTTAEVDQGAAELRELVAGLISQYTREVEATCPCRARDGDFASVDECTEKLGHRPSFAECVADQIAELDSDELRRSLRCMRQRYEERARCLEQRGCGLHEAEVCYAASRECPVLDPEALSRALLECPGGTLLGR